MGHLNPNPLPVSRCRPLLHLHVGGGLLWRWINCLVCWGRVTSTKKAFLPRVDRAPVPPSMFENFTIIARAFRKVFWFRICGCGLSKLLSSMSKHKFEWQGKGLVPRVSWIKRRHVTRHPMSSFAGQSVHVRFVSFLFLSNLDNGWAAWNHQNLIRPL